MRFEQVATEENQAQSAFWEEVGAGFPSLKGAASTAYYFECERRLFEECQKRMSVKELGEIGRRMEKARDRATTPMKRSSAGSNRVERLRMAVSTSSW